MTEACSRGTRCALACGLGLFLLCGLLHCPTALAYRGVHEALESLDRKIERDLENTQLHLRRGEVHRVHRDWAAVLADYERDRALDPRLTTVDFCLGRMLFEAGWLRPPLVALDRFLELEPEHLHGWVCRARVLAKLGLNREAAVEYTRVISGGGVSRKPRPGYYLERARMVVARDDILAEAGRFEEARLSYKEALAALGPQRRNTRTMLRLRARLEERLTLEKPTEGEES